MTPQSSGPEVRADIAQLYLHRVRRFIETQTPRPGVDIQIASDGDGWLVLQGKVDSQRTKGALLDLVPEVEGAKLIVDRLRVRPS